MNLTVSVPFSCRNPCESLPNSRLIARVHMSCVAGPDANNFYLVIFSPVSGCTTPLHVCLIALSFSFSFDSFDLDLSMFYGMKMGVLVSMACAMNW